MKLQYGSVFGNFKWQAEADVDAALVPVLAGLGALQIGQRTPSSNAEKVLAGYDKRPEKFRRDSIPFSEDAADVLAEHLSSMKVEIGRNEKDEPVYANITAEVVVGRYEGSTADVKMADERAAYARHAKDLPEFAAKIGFAGELGDGTKENAPVEFLRSIRAYVNALRAAL